MLSYLEEKPSALGRTQFTRREATSAAPAASDAAAFLPHGVGQNVWRGGSVAGTTKVWSYYVFRRGHRMLV